MSKNNYTGKEEFIEYEDGTRILLDADDSPPMSDEEYAAAPKHQAKDILPPAFVKALEEGRVGRPAQATTKKQVTIRLDEDLLQTLRASGSGWQTRVNTILRETVLPNK